MVGAEVPGSALRGVTGVGVLRQNDHDPALKLRVERREQQRQRGLGDPSARTAPVGGLDREPLAGLPELLQEGPEALAPGELERQCVKYRSVHDESRNGQVPGVSWYAGSRLPERGSGGCPWAPGRTHP